MTLTQLTLTNLRNLTEQTISPSPGLNIIYGNNGSGKSSILEAIYLLARGRSFRTHLIKQLIHTDQNALMVVGKFKTSELEQPIAVGMSYDKLAKSKIRINGKTIKSSSELATLLPLLFIGSNTGRLLSSGEKQRRRCLDWGVFHVEPKFITAWKRYNVSLKQRNASLRHDEKELTTLWDVELCAMGEEITKLRQTYVDKLRPVFLNYASLLVASSTEIKSLSFDRGWNSSAISLQGYLKENYLKDKHLAYTQRGPHRADIRIDLVHGSLTSFASGGQQKLITCALLLSQVALFIEQMKQSCIILVDDLPAELDADFRNRFIQLLLSLNCQIFITGTDFDLVNVNECDDKKVFHVEHGNIQEVC